MPKRMPPGERFAQAPDRLVRELGADTALLWGAIRARMRDEAPVALAVADLGLLMGLKERATRERLSILREAGWLEAVRTGRANAWRAILASPAAARAGQTGAVVPVRPAPFCRSDRRRRADQTGAVVPVRPAPVTTDKTTEREGERETTAPPPDVCASKTENGDGRMGPAPAPSLRETIRNAPNDGAQLGVLVEGFLSRSVRQHLHAEVSACILEVLRGRHTANDVAAFFEATPHLRFWPRELAAKLDEWLTAMNLRATRRREFLAWVAWRRRLRTVSAGDAVWETAAPHIVWRAAEVDAEKGIVVLLHRDSQERVVRRSLRRPEEGAAWTFEAEAMPLLAQGAHQRVQSPGATVREETNP